MVEECPNCGRPPLNEKGVILFEKATLELRAGVACTCGTVWYADEMDDTLDENLDEMLDLYELQKRIARLEEEAGLPREVDDEGSRS